MSKNEQIGFIDASDLIEQEKENLKLDIVGRKSIIDPDIASQFREAYILLADDPTLTRIGDVSGETDRITGFSFPKSEILAALNSSSKNIGIHLAFGYNTGNFNEKLDGVTLILYGLDSKGALINLDGTVFDYSKPCPKNCPGKPDFELPETIKKINT